MTSVTVTSASALSAALASATAGETIYLAPGTYSGLSLNGINPTGNVTITSLNPATPAVLTPFSLANSSNLTFSHLEMNASSVTNGNYAYQVGGSSNITFDSDFIHGVIGGNANNAAFGMMIRGSSNVSVTNSTFEYLQNGIMDLDNNGVLLSGNSFSYMAGDGIDNSGTSNVQILNNYFTDTMAITTGLHPDAIQFWTFGTTASADNITISGNTYVRGNGIASQGIFLGQDNNLPYENVTISNNTIIGSQYNGISVGQSTGINVTGNQIVSYSDMTSFMLLENITGASVTNNRAGLFTFTSDSNLTQSGDVINAVATPGGAPTIANSGATATFQAGGAAVGVGHLLVVDTNTPALASATVSISGGFTAGDALNFANQAGITGSYNASTGVLTLTGTASQAAYQAALDSVTFSSSSANPTQGGADTSRAISFNVNDGAHASNTAAASVSIAPPTAPSLSNTGSAAGYAVGGVAVGVARSIAVTYAANSTLASASVALTGGFIAGDTLNFANQAGITGSYNASTGVLTLTGTASQAAYQAALESVTFSSSAANPTHSASGAPDALRTVSFTVSDGVHNSNSVTGGVTVAAWSLSSVLDGHAPNGQVANTAVTNPPTTLASGASAAPHDNLVGGKLASDSFILGSIGHGVGQTATLVSGSVAGHADLGGLGALTLSALSAAPVMPLTDGGAMIAGHIGFHQTDFVLPLLGHSLPSHQLLM